MKRKEQEAEINEIKTQLMQLNLLACSTKDTLPVMRAEIVSLREHIEKLETQLGRHEENDEEERRQLIKVLEGKE